MTENRLKVGVIGCGNMGSAILAGLAKKGGYELYGFDRDAGRAKALAGLGVQAKGDAEALVAVSDVVVLAVKPHQVAGVLGSVRQHLFDFTVLISIAAGVDLASLRKCAAGRHSIARCMPNTPAQVGEGVFAVCFEESFPDEKKATVIRILSDLGICTEIPESRMTAFSALVGAGPAYVFDMMQGLVMAGVTLGFQHAETRRMVEALFAGCAKMSAANPQKHLVQLRDDVCSPAGLTIAGVQRMAVDGLSGKLAEAVFESNRRGREMEKR